MTIPNICTSPEFWPSVGARASTLATLEGKKVNNNTWASENSVSPYIKLDYHFMFPSADSHRWWGRPSIPRNLGPQGASWDGWWLGPGQAGLAWSAYQVGQHFARHFPLCNTKPVRQPLASQGDLGDWTLNHGKTVMLGARPTYVLVFYRSLRVKHMRNWS